MSKYTWHAKWPLGKTPWLAAIILVLLLSLAEVALRSDFIRSILPPSSIASGHRTLDFKLALLDEFLNKEGRVDCIFLGGSIVHRAINPEIFSQVYKTYTTKNILCFNFGLPGYTPPVDAIMARILTERYHPELLVWGISPASFGKRSNLYMKLKLINNPWTQYRLGNYSLEGWLADNSYAYRYYLSFRIWMEQPAYYKLLVRAESFISRHGHHKAESAQHVEAFRPMPEKVATFSKMLKDFEMEKIATTALDQMMRLRSRVGIMIVEIPVHRSLLSLYGKGPDDHFRATSYIAQQAERNGILFIPTMHLDLIPDEGWRDINHMNSLGSRIFTLWLGRQIGEAVKEGLIKDPFNEAT